MRIFLPLLLLAFVVGCDGSVASPSRSTVAGGISAWQIATEPLPPIGAQGAASTAPLAGPADGRFEFQPMGSEESSWRRFQVTIQGGGNPAAVAETKLTPLFSVDGKDATTYVTEAFFSANPSRRPTTIQPGDTFLLSLPPDTFVVRSFEVQEETIERSARLAEYVSDYGDVLRYYLTDSFPIHFEIAAATAPTQWTVHLHPELPILARAGRTDANRLARLIYRVPDPDILQVEAARVLLAEGAPRTIVVDRSQSHLDVARQFDDLAVQTERVPDPSLHHLVRRVFSPEQDVPFMAVEDAIAADDTREGVVVRVEYRWDGSVRVVYRTGREDTRGKRDPYQLREDERWAALYRSYGANPEAPPTKWGSGTPSDLPPFPSARDPWQRGESYDFLVPGRYLVLTFQPTRYGEPPDATLYLNAKEALKSLRDRYQAEISLAFDFVDVLRDR